MLKKHHCRLCSSHFVTVVVSSIQDEIFETKVSHDFPSDNPLTTVTGFQPQPEFSSKERTSADADSRILEDLLQLFEERCVFLARDNSFMEHHIVA